MPSRKTTLEPLVTWAKPSAAPTVRAVECIRRLRGGSQPYLLRAEDGGNYVVKFRNNPQHVRVLANEMLAGRLATLIGLPIPDVAFVEVLSLPIWITSKFSLRV